MVGAVFCASPFAYLLYFTILETPVTPFFDLRPIDEEWPGLEQALALSYGEGSARPKTAQSASSSTAPALCPTCVELAAIGAPVGGFGCTCYDYLMDKADKMKDMKDQESPKANDEQEFSFDFYSSD